MNSEKPTMEGTIYNSLQRFGNKLSVETISCFTDVTNETVREKTKSS